MSHVLRQAVFLLLAALAVLVTAAPAIGDDRAAGEARPVIRPGHEETLFTALRESGLVCADGGGECSPDIGIEQGRVTIREGARRFELRWGPDGDGCIPAPAGLAVCPAVDSEARPGPVDDAARDAAAILARRPESARAIAAVWAAPPAAHVPYVRPASRALDGILALWLVALAVSLTLAFVLSDAVDRWSTALVAALAIAMRVAVPAVATLWYFPAAPEGPFPDVFTVSIPPVLFDSPYRLFAALPFADDRWLMGLHTVLGALAPAAAALGLRRLGAPRTLALVFGLLLAAHPLLVWLSRSDSYHLWPTAAFSAALLGFSLERGRIARALGLSLVALSLVLGSAARLETAPGLFLVGALVLAADPAQARRRLLPILATLFVAAGTALLVSWEAVRSVLAAEAGPPATDIPSRLIRTAARALVAQDTLTPAWAWTVAVAPGLAVGLVSWLWRRRWLSLAVAVVGPLGAAALVLATNKELEHTGNWRYAVLALPFVLWWAATGWSALLAPLVRRSWRWAALALIPPAILFGATWSELTGVRSWTAEYAFLADALDALPETCTVTAVQPVGGDVGAPDAFLALPYAPIQLRHRGLTWNVIPPGAPVPPFPGDDDADAGCQAVYVGAVCDQVDQWSPGPPSAEQIDGLVRAVAPTCRALRASLKGQPVRAARYDLLPARIPAGLLPEQTVELELWRVR